MTYPASVGTRYKVKYGYQFGDVASVREFTGDVDGTVLWSLTTLDPLGNPIDETYGNGLRVVSGFNPLTGLLEYRQAGVGGSSNNRQSLTFGWDKTNNLTQRQDLFQQPTVTENVYYDALNRLDYSTLNGSQNLDVTLDLIGNITARSDVGSYTYHATKKHAVIAAGGTSYGYDPNGNLTSRSNASGSTAVTWTSYNYPSSIVFTPAGGAPTNVALNKPTTGSGTPCVASEGPEKAVNGSVSGGNSDKWCSLQTTKWMQVDLQSSQAITQFVVKHAAAGGEFGVWNTRDFTIQVSADGVTWSTAVTVSGNTAGTTTHPVSVTARYARLNVLTPTSDGNPAARIYEFEVWAGSSGTSLSSQFLYTPDRQYFRQVATYADGPSSTEYVGGVMEILTVSGSTQYRHLVPAGNGLVIHTRSSSAPVPDTRYLTRDHLGSISLITDATGLAEMAQSFAAYGARRQANWQAGTPSWAAIANSTRRGYTGHTMLDNLNLVHMNGRVYDPAIGRFMSADPVADGAGEPGGFNRYAYVRNNPLSLIDPRGFESKANDRPNSRPRDGDRSDAMAELASEFSAIHGSNNFFWTYQSTGLMSGGVPPVWSFTGRGWFEFQFMQGFRGPNGMIRPQTVAEVERQNQEELAKTNGERFGRSEIGCPNDEPNCIAVRGSAVDASSRPIGVPAGNTVAIGGGRVLAPPALLGWFRMLAIGPTAVAVAASSIVGGDTQQKQELYGPYFRYESSTVNAEMIRSTGVLWGGVAFHGNALGPAARAYTGPWMNGTGPTVIKFWTFVKPTTQSPHTATWYLGTPGVFPIEVGGTEKAAIPIITER